MPVTGRDAASRRAFLILAAVMPARAARAETVSDLFAALAGALSSGDAAAFLLHFDRRMTGYAELRRNVAALLVSGGAGSSIGSLEESGGEEKRAVRVDWVLDIGGRRRRESVRCELERRGRKWRIVALQPVAFFAP